MQENVAERLIQKTASLIEQNVEMNARVQGFFVVNETISSINGRIDAIQSSLKHLEKGIQLDEHKIQELEYQTKDVKECIATFTKTVEGLNSRVQRLEGKVEGLAALTESADKFIGRLKWRVSIMWITHLITAAFLVAMFLLLRIH
jgi:chromosome segregation ATPase